MEVEGIEQTSPLIKKIIGLKIRKLNTDSLNDIITRARNMTKLTLPSGCSQNLKAEFQDPEKALEYSKRKNRINLFMLSPHFTCWRLKIPFVEINL